MFWFRLIVRLIIREIVIIIEWSVIEIELIVERVRRWRVSWEVEVVYIDSIVDSRIEL